MLRYCFSIVILGGVCLQPGSPRSKNGYRYRYRRRVEAEEYPDENNFSPSQCQDLKFKNVIHNCTNGLYENSLCTFKCDKGYDLHPNHDQATCISIEETQPSSRGWRKQRNYRYYQRYQYYIWNQTVPSCYAPCKQFLLLYGYSKCDKGNKIDSFCSFRCNHGYELEGDFTHSRCSKSTLPENSRWSPWLPTCQVTCPQISIRNGKVLCNGGKSKQSIGSRCTFTCHATHKLLGIRRVTCNKISEKLAKWSDGFPSCRPICKKETVENGQSICPEELRSGSTCVHSCNLIYDLIGSETTICREINSDVAIWQPPTPYCKSAQNFILGVSIYMFVLLLIFFCTILAYHRVICYPSRTYIVIDDLRENQDEDNAKPIPEETANFVDETNKNEEATTSTTTAKISVEDHVVMGNLTESQDEGNAKIAFQDTANSTDETNKKEATASSTTAAAVAAGDDDEKHIEDTVL